MQRLWILICSTVLLYVTQGFFSNHYKLKLNGDDWTHFEITEKGILQAVAMHFERNPRNNVTLPSGTLTKMVNLTARKLFSKYYGDDVPTTRFQEAISDIIRQNNRVDLEYNDIADWHFNGDRVEEGFKKMVQMRQDILALLNVSNPNYDAARHLIGQYLYVLQTFYSNTNWVEMLQGDICTEIGIHPLPQHLAPNRRDSSPCRSCGMNLGSNCSNNIIINDKLTSGYRSGQDIVKPYKDPAKFTEGKCSHGGELDDSSRDSAALGGINKDTSSELLSPHYYDHTQAAEYAVRHTDYFFSHEQDGLVAQIGNEKFEELLQFQTATSLVFVIDTTGSMSDDIHAVQRKTREIIQETNGTDLQPYKYILVEFNDPASLTKTRITRSPDEILQWLEALTVHGGGDCPEFSLTGIKQAAIIADPNSVMYIFTDASAKDEADQYSYVASLVTSKNLKLEFLVTGSCSRKRSTEPKGITMRTATKAGYTYANLNAYHQLAEISDGAVFESTKSDISAAVDVVKETLKGSLASVANGVISPSNSLSALEVYADSTMQELNIRIQSDLSYIRPVLYRPDGSLEEFDSLHNTFRNVGTRLIYISIRHPMVGMWHIVRTEETDMVIDVTSRSSVDFKIMFVEDGHDNYTEFEMDGNPIAGRLTTMVVFVPQIEELSTVSNFSLFTAAGNKLISGQFKQGQGHAKRYMRATFVIPSQSFFVQILGTDKHGDIFSRRSSQPFNPTDMEIRVTMTDTGNITDRFPTVNGFPIHINYTVTLLQGEAKVIDFDLNADNSLIIRGNKKQSHALQPHTSFSGQFQLARTAHYHVVSMVTFVASPQLSGTGNQFRVLWV